MHVCMCLTTDRNGRKIEGVVDEDGARQLDAYFTERSSLTFKVKVHKWLLPFLVKNLIYQK